MDTSIEILAVAILLYLSRLLVGLHDTRESKGEVELWGYVSTELIGSYLDSVNASWALERGEARTKQSSSEPRPEPQKILKRSVTGFSLQV